MNIDQLSKAIKILQDMKALDGKIIEVSKHCSYADYFILVSATSTTHAQAMSDQLKTLSKGSNHPEGYQSGQWILNDLGDIIVHIFLRDLRAMYQLDKLWAHAPTIELDEQVPAQHFDQVSSL